MPCLICRSDVGLHPVRPCAWPRPKRRKYTSNSCCNENISRKRLTFVLKTHKNIARIYRESDCNYHGMFARFGGNRIPKERACHANVKAT